MQSGCGRRAVAAWGRSKTLERSYQGSWAARRPIPPLPSRADQQPRPVLGHGRAEHSRYRPRHLQRAAGERGDGRCYAQRGRPATRMGCISGVPFLCGMRRAVSVLALAARPNGHFTRHFTRASHLTVPRIPGNEPTATEPPFFSVLPSPSPQPRHVDSARQHVSRHSGATARHQSSVFRRGP